MSVTLKYIGPLKQPFGERLSSGERIRIVPGEDISVNRDEADYLVETYPDRYEAVKPAAATAVREQKEEPKGK